MSAEGFEKALAQRKKYLLGEGVDPGALYGAFGVQSQWFTGQSAPDSQGGQEAAAARMAVLRWVSALTTF